MGVANVQDRFLRLWCRSRAQRTLKEAGEALGTVTRRSYRSRSHATRSTFTRNGRKLVTPGHGSRKSSLNTVCRITLFPHTCLRQDNGCSAKTQSQLGTSQYWKIKLPTGRKWKPIYYQGRLQQLQSSQQDLSCTGWKRSLTQFNLYRRPKSSHTEPSLMGKDDLGHVKFPAEASTRDGPAFPYRRMPCSVTNHSCVSKFGALTHT